MTEVPTVLTRLYLLQLMTTTVPLPDGRRLAMSSGCYLVQTSDGHSILIDTGQAEDSYSSAMGHVEGRTNVLEQLAALHVRPEEISTVICTHFDVDHAGYHDSFPQAEFIVQRTHYELARSGYPRLVQARAHWDHPALEYRLIDGDLELLPGLTLLETSGHVTGHQSVLLRLPQTGPVLLAIDAVAMQRAFTPERRATPIDENEEQLIASTRKLLDIVEREGVQLTVFHHDGLQWQGLRLAPDYYA